MDLIDDGVPVPPALSAYKYADAIVTQVHLLQHATPPTHHYAASRPSAAECSDVAATEGRQDLRQSCHAAGTVLKARCQRACCYAPRERIRRGIN